MKIIPASPTFLLVALLSVATLSGAPAAASDPSAVSPATHAGGLMCFSITPARYDGHRLPSCDQLCAAKGAVCVVVQGTQNPQGCELPNADGAAQKCRCCALAH